MAANDNKTRIQILHQDEPSSSSSREIPVYSVPLQTTAMLNIFLPTSKEATGFQCLESSATDNANAVDDNDSDDSDAELDVANLERNAGSHKSSFSYISWDTPKLEVARQECGCIIVMKDPDIVTMIKASCQTKGAASSKILWDLLVDITENFSKRLKRMKGLSLPKICAQHMDTLPLTDGQPTRVHISKVSKDLKETVALKDVAYRFQSDDAFIGTFVNDTMSAKRNYSIGRVGVIAVLSKKSKYAAVEAFSEQLCKHIAENQPISLGKISETDIKKINKRGTVKILHLQKDQLLLQNFLFDPTIIVAEAARRSFVKIDDFLLFK